MTRFRVVEAVPDPVTGVRAVRFNLDSDSEVLRVVPPIILGTVAPNYIPLRHRKGGGMEPAGKSKQETEMLIRVRTGQKQESMDALLALWNELGEELDRTGLIEYRPEGASESFFIDYYDSPIPSLHQATTFPWWTKLEIATPIVLSITRHHRINDADGNRVWI